MANAEEKKCGCYLITKIHQTARRISGRKLKDYSVEEINPAQGRVLFFLWQNDGVTSINELADQTSLGKPTLTSLLDRLEENGYVRRIRDEFDRRKILIEVLPTSDDLKQVYTRVFTEMTELMYDGFTKAEIAQCENFLKRISENLINVEKGNQ